MTLAGTIKSGEISQSCKVQIALLGTLLILALACLLAVPAMGGQTSRGTATFDSSLATTTLNSDRLKAQQVETIRRDEVETQPIDRIKIRDLERILTRKRAEQRIDSDRIVREPVAIPTSVATIAPTPSATLTPMPRPTTLPSPTPSVAPTRPSPNDRLRPGSVELIRTTAIQEKQLAQSIATNPEVFELMDDSRSEVVALPNVMRQLDTEGDELLLKPYVLMARPLVFEPKSETFRGSIMVGVGEVSQANRRRELTRPIMFQVFGQGSATPNPLELDETTPPHKEIEIVVPAALAGADVTVVSLFDPDGTIITLPLEPTLRIDATSGSMEAFGLATTEINVAVPGLEDPAGRVVSLQSRPAAFFEETRLTLDENGMASTRVRSEGVGPLTIRANMTGMVPTDVRIDVRFPYLTLAAAVLGGMLGALVRVLGSKQAKQDGFRWRLFIASALAGIMIFTLYAVGVNVLPVTPTVTVGATLVFAVSGLGAFLGIALLDALRPRHEALDHEGEIQAD